jgi:hypothetical protein
LTGFAILGLTMSSSMVCPFLPFHTTEVLFFILSLAATDWNSRRHSRKPLSAAFL